MKTNVKRALSALRHIDPALRAVLRDAIDHRRVEQVYSQSSHGFSLGDWVYKNTDGDWAKADRDSISTLARGMVSYVNGDEFAVCTDGEVRDNSLSFTVNVAYYLSSTAGTITSTKPSTGYVQEVRRGTDTDTFNVSMQRAFIPEEVEEFAGKVVAYLGSAAPTGWLFLNGQTLGNASSGADNASDEYEDLFNIIKDVSPNAGTEVFSNGDTVTLPDMAKRMPVGFDDAGVPDADFDTLGETGGSKTHQLVQAELPNVSFSVTDGGHTHGVTDGGHTHGLNHDPNTAGGATADHIGTGASTGTYNTASATTGISVDSNTTGITVSSGGSDTAHENMSPYLVMNFIVKY